MLQRRHNGETDSHMPSRLTAAGICNTWSLPAVHDVPRKAGLQSHDVTRKAPLTPLLIGNGVAPSWKAGLPAPCDEFFLSVPWTTQMEMLAPLLHGEGIVSSVPWTMPRTSSPRAVLASPLPDIISFHFIPSLSRARYGKR